MPRGPIGADMYYGTTRLRETFIDMS
jgi:hypothetical protein